MDANVWSHAKQILSGLPDADPYSRQWEFDPTSSGAGINDHTGSFIDLDYPQRSQPATSSGFGINDHTGGSFIDPSYPH